MGKNPFDHFGDVFFCRFSGDFTHFGDKPKTIVDSNNTRAACYPSNLAWFLMIGLIFPTVTSRMFSTVMQNFNLPIFMDAGPYMDADVDTDVDIHLEADAYFELIFLEVNSLFFNFAFF